MFSKKMLESAVSAAKSNKSKGKRGFGLGQSTVSAAGSAVSALNSKRPSTSTSKSKKKRKRGNLFEDIGFSGSPDRKSKTMFGQSYDPGGVMDRLSARRNIRKARGF